MTTVRYRLPDLPETVRRLTDAEGERLDATGSRLWKNSPKVQCLTCMKLNGNTFRWYAPGSRNPESIGDYECTCAAQYRLHRWMNWAGIGLNYQRVDWDDALDLESPAANGAVDYTLNARVYANTGMNMTFWSQQPGTGKTFFASMLAKRLLLLGYDIFFSTFAEILDLYTASWRSDEERVYFNGRVSNAQILFVDDLGREHPGRMQVAESMLDVVLRRRLAACMPTIITTNLQPEQISNYGANLVSLLSERMILQEVPGKDARPLMYERATRERDLRLCRPIVIS